MQGTTKHVFWEALLITIVVFIAGMLIGVSFEGNRLDKIEDYYTISEISMMDILALNNILAMNNLSCENLAIANADFADRIYEEARLLEKYEGAGKVSNDLKLAHKKYDLMRTFLWVNSIKTFERCGEDYNVVVYLYEYDTEELSQKAIQNVWSKVLFDLKQEVGSSIVLIPIAADADLASLGTLLRDFEIEQYPVVIINNEHMVDKLSSTEDLKKYLD